MMAVATSPALLDSLSIIAKSNWEFLFQHQEPHFEYNDGIGIYFHLPTEIDSFSAADAMADDLRDIGLDVVVMDSELGTFHLYIPEASLSEEIEALVNQEAAETGSIMNDRYCTPHKY